jgi:uncharacterized protein YbaA (DUF1428 family)
MCWQNKERAMSYIDGVVVAVPSAGKQAYLDYAKRIDPIFKEYGALAVVEGWGEDVPDGKVTDFKRAVQANADETIVFSWIKWPDKATRDAAWDKIMKAERMSGADMPFDGKRMIYGGFEVVLEI